MNERTTAERLGRATGALIFWGVILAVLYGALAPYRFGLIVGGGALLAAWVVFNEKKIHSAANPAPPPGPEGVDDTNPQFKYTEDRPGHWSVERAEDN